MQVDASVEPDVVVINGLAIAAAVPPSCLRDVLGVPDRVVDPAAPAPYGHRNHQIHVHDALGLYFHEHHFTRLAMSLTFVFWPEEEGYRFSPSRPFSGRLLLNRYEVPAVLSESDAIRNSALPFHRHLAGIWRAAIGGITVGVLARGARLASGRRSENCRVVSIDVSWPHDPWRPAEPSAAADPARRGGS